MPKIPRYVQPTYPRYPRSDKERKIGQSQQGHLPEALRLGRSCGSPNLGMEICQSMQSSHPGWCSQLRTILCPSDRQWPRHTSAWERVIKLIKWKLSKSSNNSMITSWLCLQPLHFWGLKLHILQVQPLLVDLEYFDNVAFSNGLRKVCLVFVHLVNLFHYFICPLTWLKWPLEPNQVNHGQANVIPCPDMPGRNSTLMCPRVGIQRLGILKGFQFNSWQKMKSQALTYITEIIFSMLCWWALGWNWCSDPKIPTG